MASACSSLPPNADGRAPSDVTLREDTTPTARLDSLSLGLDVPAEVAAGRIVRIRLRARNTTERTIHLHLRGREVAFDVVVRRPDGSVVWRRLQDRAVPAILRLEILEPGEALELEARWDQRTNDGAAAGPGAYTVRGSLLTDQPRPIETEPVPLRVVG